LETEPNEAPEKQSHDAKQSENKGKYTASSREIFLHRSFEWNRNQASTYVHGEKNTT
jgi:hypothetical protein